MAKLKIIIAGGGIGGLTTALCLAGPDRDIHVYESALAIRPLGVGINLLPHAVRVLHHLGLEQALEPLAVATRELAYYSRHGKKIWEEPRGRFAGYKWPQYSIHRGQFQWLLLEKLKERIGAGHIHTGFALQGIISTRAEVTASFINRNQDNREEIVQGDLLVGADGIHSQVRKQFYPDEGNPKFSGILLHRGTTRARPM